MRDVVNVDIRDCEEKVHVYDEDIEELVDEVEREVNYEVQRYGRALVCPPSSDPYGTLVRSAKCRPSG